VLALLGAIDDPAAHGAVRAERAFLAALGGGCTLPLGALAVSGESGDELVIDGFLASRDGRILVRHRVTGPATEPADLGASLARAMPDDRGGRSLDDWSDP
jgi:hydroxymethylbilane synthase